MGWVQVRVGTKAASGVSLASGTFPRHSWRCLPLQVEERSKMNRQSSPALQHKVANRISDPSLPPRSESFSSGGIQQARTPPMHRSVEPQVPSWLHTFRWFIYLYTASETSLSGSRTLPVTLKLIIFLLKYIPNSYCIPLRPQQFINDCIFCLFYPLPSSYI